MARYSSKIGDIYCVKLDDATQKYFQYIASDMTQLNSSVIRVFKKHYNVNDIPTLTDIVKDEIDFYVHVVIRWGEDKEMWKKVGTLAEIGKKDVQFKDAKDFTDPKIKISEKWSVWNINEPMKFVGKLEGENRKAEIGLVIAPFRVLQWIRTGKLNIAYPGYDESSIMTYVHDEEGKRNHELIEQFLANRKKKKK